MGHLMPFLRLAATLASRGGCTVTLITPTPTVSAAESTHLSTFFSSHPHIHRLQFQIPIHSLTTPTNTTDPFFIRWSQISQSIHLLSPLLSSLSPPPSAIYSDFMASMTLSQVADQLSIPYYVVYTNSARFLSFVASLPSLNFATTDDYLEIPDLPPLPRSFLTPPFFNDPNQFFRSFALSNVQSLLKAKGVFVNTFEKFEAETIVAINSGRQLSSILPRVIPVGPLEPYNVERGEKSGGGNEYFSWLDGQSDGSVVYVSFGSRTAMSKEQRREIGDGLERSGCAFFWVLKGSKVDGEDTAEIEELVGEGFIERTRNRGVAVKGWVEQEKILSHPAIGGFVSHCGWNSVMEACRHGVRVLGWPLHGEQKVNAEMMEKVGLGVWMREWGGERLVRGEEIGEKVREMMSDEELRRSGKEIAGEARKAWEENGSSLKALMEAIEVLKHSNRIGS